MVCRICFYLFLFWLPISAFLVARHWKILKINVEQQVNLTEARAGEASVLAGLCNFMQTGENICNTFCVWSDLSKCWTPSPRWLSGWGWPWPCLLCVFGPIRVGCCQLGSASSSQNQQLPHSPTTHPSYYNDKTGGWPNRPPALQPTSKRPAALQQAQVLCGKLTRSDIVTEWEMRSFLQRWPNLLPH